jgi:DNA-binding SARP family transcriptional activator
LRIKKTLWIRTSPILAIRNTQYVFRVTQYITLNANGIIPSTKLFTIQSQGDPMSHLSLSFLGGFDVTLDAAPVTTFGVDKARALLTFLAMESTRPHRRAELSAMFWPDSPEKNAAHNLSQSLLRLRQALREKETPVGPPFLLATPRDVQFNVCSDYQLDVDRFRTLLNQCQQHQHLEAARCSLCIQWQSQAMELYRGNLLAGLFVPDSVAFEEWRLIQQEDLHRLALETLTRLTTYHAQRGEHERVIEYARRQIALEPWHEEAHIQLIQAFAQSGQTSAALRQYESYQHTLLEELGIQPSADVSAFYARLRSGEGAQSLGGQTPETGTETIWLSSEGERRQVTTLVCGYGLQEGRDNQEDPEEIQEQMTFCERHCAAVFHRFGGRRARRQGTTCLVYFGYPQAHEDASRRAVHSALAIVSASRGDESVRIGIHTGMVTVGEKRGSRWQDRDLVGTALEIARDCHHLARPGEVIITESTRQLVQDAFDLQSSGQAVTASGERWPVYQVCGGSDAQNRLDWLAQTQRMTTYAGCEAELSQVRTCYEGLRQGKGQVILLTGEPGIGKSRLLWELKTRVHTLDVSTASTIQPQPPVPWFTGRCLPHDQNTNLYPLIGLLEQLLGFEAGDSLDARRAKLIQTLTAYDLDQPAAIWLLSLMLGLPTGGLAPKTITRNQRDQMSEIFIALLQKYARVQPLVLVIEDLHWSDPSTVDWLGQFIPALGVVPCLTLLTARPGFKPTWLTDVQPNLLQIFLHPLPSEQAEQIVVDLAGDGSLDETLRHQIVALADGIPLFVEELTKTLLERPTLQPKLKVPATLHDLLAARLDRLGPAKETAQWAAVLGREFSYPILQACTPYDEQRLQSDLAELIEAELVLPVPMAIQMVSLHRTAVTTRYTFKHILMQEAAYASLLKRTRQVYHRRVAEMLETRFVQIAETRPEILAQHYVGAGMPAKAVDYWLRAGEYAMAQGAIQEARIFFERALEKIESDDRERRWRALEGREKALDFLGEREAQGVDLNALLALAEVFEDDTRRAQVYLRQTVHAGMQGDYQATLPLAEAASSAARSVGNLSLELRALAYQAQTLTFLKEMDSAGRVVEKALEQVNNITDDSVRAQVFTVAAFYYLESGDFVQSVLLQRQGAEAARQAEDLALELKISANLGLIYTLIGLYSLARSTLETVQDRVGMVGDRRLQASNLRHLGYAYWRCGDHGLAQQIEEQALKELAATGDTYGVAACMAYLGYIFEDIGEWKAAAEYLAKARLVFAEMEMDTDRFEAQVIEARVALVQGKPEEARQLVTGVWDYLCEHGTKDLNSPARFYTYIIDVLAAVEIPGVSRDEVIVAGYNELMQKAEKISDADWRRAFLENIAENQKMVMYYLNK